jgi:PleD family two-component response regulator
MDRNLTFSGKILVADDEKVNVEFFEVMLTKLGFTVEVAYSGEEVFEKLKTFDPDLIILDLLMPKMSGFQVATRLKADRKTSEIPIIILTAVSDIRDKVDMLELGIEDYIMKPFNFIEILARIRNVLRVGALREELKAYEKKLGYVDDFIENVHQFLQKADSFSKDIVESGEKQLMKVGGTSMEADESASKTHFVKNVVEAGRSQLEVVDAMKCRHRELIQLLHNGG